MKIYIGVVSSDEIVSRIKDEMFKCLRPYYDKTSSDGVEVYNNGKSEYAEVYVMENVKYPGSEDEVKRCITSLMDKFIKPKQLNISLNYKRLDPNFAPTSVSEKNAEMLPKAKNDISSNKPSSEFDYDKLSENYSAEEPRYSFEQVILPESVREQIIEAVGTIQAEPKVFDEWGLRNIIPNASSAISFYGPPGTGKSMAAEAIAKMLGKKVLRATYADIESKYHGEGPKMVKAIFRAAERDNAVLFLDESDSLLSKRLTNVTDGSAQAINSMRSQLLISLESFRGIVIFATNLVVNYDKAFLSRLINIEFFAPDVNARKNIWEQHLRGKGLNIPLAENVDTDELANKYEFCGREIKNSVKDACVTVVISGRDIVTQADIIKACEKTKTESERILKAEDHTATKNPSEETKELLKKQIQKQLDENKLNNEKEIEKFLK